MILASQEEKVAIYEEDKWTDQLIMSSLMYLWNDQVEPSTSGTNVGTNVLTLVK